MAASALLSAAGQYVAYGRPAETEHDTRNALDAADDIISKMIQEGGDPRTAQALHEDVVTSRREL